MSYSNAAVSGESNSVGTGVRELAGVRRCGVHRLVSALCLWVVVGSTTVAAQQPQTGAEAAGFTRTTSHEELLEFLQEIRALTDHMLVVELTTTNLGRSLPMVILGEHPSATPGTAWFSGKPTVLFTGSVHGNERAGKEGSQHLILELAIGELQPLLEEVNVLIVPSLNPDGAEASSRTNSLGYDMNRGRDHLLVFRSSSGSDDRCVGVDDHGAVGTEAAHIRGAAKHRHLAL